MGTGAPIVAEDWASRDPRWRGVRAETIRVQGHPVRVLRHDATGEGDPQLFVHGLGGSARNWLDVLGPLSKHGQTLAVDLPGFGATPIPRRGSARVRASAGFVRALIDALGWVRITLYGNSMGGLIATLVAGRHPARIGRLVLVNPALPAPRRSMLRQLSLRVFTRIIPAAIPGVGRLVIEAGLRQRTAEELVEESIASVFADVERCRPAMRDALIENAELAKREPWRRAGLADAAGSLVMMIAEAGELNHAIDSIDAPTLLLWGDDDRLVTGHVIAGLVERRPGWDQHVFGGVGHAPMVEAPDEFATVVDGWHAS
ncbi:MAG: alpha/beta hydrolase [Actinobacteria bacterium]|nr:alpha/beta hydrolase [Actinomycetota bacterium]